MPVYFHFFSLLHTRVCSQIIILSSKCRLEQHSTDIHVHRHAFFFAARFRLRTTFNKIVHIVSECVCQYFDRINHFCRSLSFDI
jgi:hypothetical protein